MSLHIFNLKPSPKTENKQVFLVEPEKVGQLPPSIDLRAKFPPVYDQGQLGACSAMAMGAALQVLNPTYEPSQLFIYYNERRAANEVFEDAGSTLAIGVQTINQYGACPESEWPYDITKFEIQPPTQCYTDARTDILLGFQEITGDVVPQIKQALVQGFPVVFGMQVFGSLESEQTAQTGIVDLPAPNEQSLGGHAVVFAGYDDARQSFLVRNSWGPQWGQGGYFWLPYTYVSNPELVFDIWVIKKVND